MKTAKNTREQTYSPLGALTVETSAYQVCATRFDFGINSAILRHLVQSTFTALEDYDRKNRIQRVAPFTLIINWQGQIVPVCSIRTSSRSCSRARPQDRSPAPLP